MHLGIVLSRSAQDVYDLSHGVLGILGPFGYLYHSLVAILAFLECRFGDEDIIGQGAVLSEQVGVILPDLQRTHKRVVGPLHYFCHESLSHMIPSASHHGGLYSVPVHGMHAVALCHQYGFCAVGRFKYVLAVGLASEHSLHHLRGCVEAVVITRLLLDIIVHQHLVQYVHHQHLGRMRLQIQGTVECF